MIYDPAFRTGWRGRPAGASPAVVGALRLRNVHAMLGNAALPTTPTIGPKSISRTAWSKDFVLDDVVTLRKSATSLPVA
jgi:hypothetical protein